MLCSIFSDLLNFYFTLKRIARGHLVKARDLTFDRSYYAICIWKHFGHGRQMVDEQQHYLIVDVDSFKVGAPNPQFFDRSEIFVPPLTERVMM